MTKKKIKRILIKLFIVVLVALVLFLVYRHHRLYDNDKPNIFLIEGTEYELYEDISKLNEYVRCYMVQRVPDTRAETEQMIFDFIEESDIVKETFQAGAKALRLKFYVPSLNFPVYYYDSESDWDRFGHIGQYKDNLFFVVAYESETSEPRFYYYEIYNENVIVKWDD